ncbi:prenyltransferase [Kocuria sp. M1R5S2]|uniref:prenyltransferase n=1 Tax=Kocuria rhizosphaerae TaxID=3376285 RepID=UPI00378A75AD
MTYALIIPVFLALAVVPATLLVRRPSPAPPPRRAVPVLALCFAVLAVLTVVFDSLMIAAGLFDYGDGRITGLRIGLAPVEDLAYPLAALLLLPALWWGLAERGRLGSTVRTLVATSRPVSWINTAFPFAAAYVLTTGRVDLSLVVGTLFFLFPYNLLMYGINDVFDYESDLRNPRKGGVEGALVDRSEHRMILVGSVLVALPFLLHLFPAGGAAAGAVLAVSLFAVVAYSLRGLRFKEVPFLDSATSATHFVSPAVYGLVLAGAGWSAGTVALCGAFFLWSMASQAFGAVQDVQADREGGLRSIATVLGARATVRAAAVLYAVAGTLLLLTPWPGPLASFLVLPYLANLVPFLTIDDAGCERANRGWKRFLWLNYVTGFLVTMLLIWSWSLTR